ncbi:MAG: potassium transporter TrkG [Pseudomonadota bacterium]
MADTWIKRSVRIASPDRATPLFAPALGVVAVAMAVPMLHALSLGDERTARAFLYGGLFSGFSAVIMGVALSGRRTAAATQSELITLLASWLILPAFAAIPLVILSPQLGLAGAWTEMVACLSTTGGTVYAEPGRQAPSIHLWRATVAWLGGLMTLTAVYVILAPRRMGGFEVLGAGTSGAMDARGVRLAELGAAMPPSGERVRRALRAIVPVYVTMSFAAIMLFGLAGGVTLDNVIHALGTISTSGITSSREGLAADPSIGVELVAAFFLVLAATARPYGAASRIDAAGPWYRDPELQLMALLVASAAGLLFLRHWTAALTLSNPDSGAGEALRALWGTLFTAMSFITTTGYESASWRAAQAWGGLDNPSLVLLGLCAIGGGAATTAGGIKLIRAVALLRHGMDEINRLARPETMHRARSFGGGGGRGATGGLAEGAFLGWAFIMLYTAAIFAVTLALGLAGLNFQTALIAAIAAVSNTGPAFAAVAQGIDGFAQFDALQRVVLGFGMVIGRMETLALIALFNRGAWSGLLSARKRSGNTREKRPQSRR